MSDFEVVYEGDYHYYRSKVYAIDNLKDRFLIVNTDGYFRWVDTTDCRLVKDE